MNNGVLLFAHNNHKIDYIKQAIYCAIKIKKHLNLPVALATNSKSYLEKNFFDYQHLFDFIIDNDYKSNQHRLFSNGHTTEKLPWNNFTRCEAYDISPFDNTLVLDTDFLVGNSNLLKCFDNKQFKINKEIIDCNPQRNDHTLERISETTIDMYWATVFYFSKNKLSKILFELIKHIRDNWNFYRIQYQMVGQNFRNDFAFAIALHLLGNPQHELPTKLFFTTDNDRLLSIDNEKYKFLLKTTNFMKNDTVCSLEDVNIHIMNKFDLSANIDRVLS